jgi:hypothetical protein
METVVKDSEGDENIKLIIVCQYDPILRKRHAISEQDLIWRIPSKLVFIKFKNKSKLADKTRKYKI